jgi:hypothetical protein
MGERSANHVADWLPLLHLPSAQDQGRRFMGGAGTVALLAAGSCGPRVRPGRGRDLSASRIHEQRGGTTAASGGDGLSGSRDSDLRHDATTRASYY